MDHAWKKIHFRLTLYFHQHPQLKLCFLSPKGKLEKRKQFGGNIVVISSIFKITLKCLEQGVLKYLPVWEKSGVFIAKELPIFLLIPVGTNAFRNNKNLFVV